MSEQPLRVALAGLGTVGGGLVRVLEMNKDLIRQRTGRDIEIRKVLVRDMHKPRSVQLPQSAVLTDKAEDLVNDPDIDVLVELMGGLNAAHTLITGALENGKHVVTANKALLAENGIGLFSKAAEKGVHLRYEAAVAGGIPIIETLKQSLAGNGIDSLLGILNGTSNYILSQMSENGLDFNTALRQAQELGYAEADPTLDIDGHDAAHKLVLLVRLAYGVEYPYTAMPIRGIRGMDAMDISFADEFGCSIKLIARASMVNGKLDAGVFPTLVQHDYLLARVNGSFNAIRLKGNAVGSLFLHGRGAGDLPTASAVMGDLVAVARGEAPCNTGFMSQTPEAADILPPEDSINRYYVRVMVHDTPGVLRDIAAAMADEGISMAQVMQKAETPNGVPLVFMTHKASARAMNNALARAVKAGLLTAPAVAYRVL